MLGCELAARRKVVRPAELAKVDARRTCPLVGMGIWGNSARGGVGGKESWRGQPGQLALGAAPLPPAPLARLHPRCRRTYMGTEADELWLAGCGRSLFAAPCTSSTSSPPSMPWHSVTLCSGPATLRRAASAAPLMPPRCGAGWPARMLPGAAAAAVGLRPPSAMMAAEARWPWSGSTADSGVAAWGRKRECCCLAMTSHAC
jgi:hypothetical protein